MLAAVAIPVKMELTMEIQKKALAVVVLVMKPKAIKLIPNKIPDANTVRSIPILYAKCVIRGTVAIDVKAGVHSMSPVSEPPRLYSRARSGRKIGKLTSPSPIHATERQNTLTTPSAIFLDSPYSILIIMETPKVAVSFIIHQKP